VKYITLVEKEAPTTVTYECECSARMLSRDTFNEHVRLGSDDSGIDETEEEETTDQ
jgi:hypothetical protein